MRPMYETTEDQERERDLALRLAPYWRLDNVVKLPIAYRLDYAGIRAGKILVWLELKWRDRAFDQYPDCFLSLNKVLAARELFEATTIPSMFVVQFADKVAYASLRAYVHYSASFAGRYDRGDWQDQEPIALIPMEEFRVLPI